MENTLWLVGQYRAGTGDGAVWDFQGVFESKELAVAACRTSFYFIAPIGLNRELCPGVEFFPACEYPKAR